MTSRAQVFKPGDFSLGQVHEFAGAFGRQAGSPQLLQSAIEDPELMRQLVSLLHGEANQLDVLPYADEVVKSTAQYPAGFRFRTPQEQLDFLLKHFPAFDASHVLELSKGVLPDSAEAWAVIPKPSKLGGLYKALEVVLGLLGQSRKFTNWREGALTDKHLRLVEKTAQVYARLEQETLGDFLVFSFQFGMRWRGCSVRHAQVRFAENEFGLDPYAVTCLLLTHPDRITGQEQLYIDCAGCDYDPAASGSFGWCLGFDWRYSYGLLDLYYYGTGDANRLWGAVSGFLRSVL